MTTRSLVRSKIGLQRALAIVPHLTSEEVHQIAEVVSHNRKGECDKLLITLVYLATLTAGEGALRIQQQVDFERSERSDLVSSIG